MSEASDIVAWIVNDGALSALIDTRVYPLMLPATPELPAITYQMVSEEQEPVQDGPGLANPRYRFKIWTRTFAELDAITLALKAAFNARHDGPFRTSLVDGSTIDHDLKTQRWWQTVDVLGWQPAGEWAVAAS